VLEVEVARKRFTVEEFHRMAEVGLLKPDDRVELIDGEIYEMSPIGEQHMSGVIALTDGFASLTLQGGAHISVQNAVLLNRISEAHPDVALLRRRQDRYRSRKPRPTDVLLIVEVSDTTLRFDLQVKLPLYARASIEEVWVVDLQDRRLIDHRDPTADTFTSVRTLSRGELFAPLNFPELLIALSDVVG
jgi:Uma2 family endonuclease